jgi:hypothetical protein
MPHKKCSLCERPAIAYRLESDGTKTYLCDGHIPLEENREVPKMTPQQAEMPRAMSKG